MDDNEPNYIEAFNNLFGKRSFANEVGLTETKTDYSHEIVNLFTVCRFYMVNVNIMSKPYNYGCSIAFKNLTKPYIKELFDAQNYNYDLIEETINELFKIGKLFNFYREMAPVKNIRLDDSFRESESFRSNNISSSNISKNITKLTISGFLTDKYTDANPLKKISKQHINFYVSETNEIHPIMTLFFPYSSTADFICQFNLHPTERDSQIKKLAEIKRDFTAHLEVQLDTVLKRKLKFKKDDLLKMTTQEKLNYIPVVEMSKI